MRKLMKLTAVIVFALVSFSAANAQSLKFGHIDLQSLVQVMPERAAAETEFNNFSKELEDVLGDLQKDYQAKIKEYEALGETASDIKKNAKVAEIQDVQQRIQNYQVSAQEQIQKKQAELLQPVFDKAKKAIEEVAQEKGLLYVFDTGYPTVIYKSNQSIDLMPMVKTKLGIQ